jgi:hypothetical protein
VRNLGNASSSLTAIAECNVSLTSLFHRIFIEYISSALVTPDFTLVSLTFKVPRTWISNEYIRSLVSIVNIFLFSSYMHNQNVFLGRIGSDVSKSKTPFAPSKEATGDVTPLMMEIVVLIFLFVNEIYGL